MIFNNLKSVDIKLPYGQRGTELFSIDEVDGGLACNCICPACKKKLIARKGRIKIHHFAHYQSEDCGGGLETALHKKAKEIIESASHLTTPEVKFPGTHYVIKEEAIIPIDSVILETRIGELIPDVVIFVKGKKLLLEIVVTNPVSPQKRQRIRLEKLPTSVFFAKALFTDLYQKGELRLLEEAFRKELIEGTKFKGWLHNPKLERVLKLLLENYAEEKKVKTFETLHTYYSFVEDCPLEKRHWKSGKYQSKPHAKTDEDCLNCPFCLELDRSKVLCVGNRKVGFGELLRNLF